jgi:hypothetical protein
MFPKNSAGRTLAMFARLAVAAAILTGVASGCANTTIAMDRAKQGAPCDAAELKEGTTAEQEQFASECRDQKDREAREKEVHQENEATREGLRLKEEGK